MHLFSNLENQKCDIFGGTNSRTFRYDMKGSQNVPSKHEFVRALFYGIITCLETQWWLKFFKKCNIFANHFIGISTLELTMKNNYHGEVYPFSNSHYDTQSQVDLFLDLSQADAMAKFMVVLILKLVMSPKLPLSALDYGTDVEQGINHFMGTYVKTNALYVHT